MAVMKDGPDGVLVTKLREDEVITEELRDKIVHALSNSLLTQVHTHIEYHTFGGFSLFLTKDAIAKLYVCKV